MPSNKSPKLTARAAYTRMWRDWLRPHKWALLFTIVLMAIVAVASAGYAKFIQYVIDAFSTGSETVAIWGPLGVIALTLSRGLSQYFRHIIQNRILSRVQVKMQNKMFSSLVNMDLRHLLAEAPAALAARFSSDIELRRISARTQKEIAAMTESVNEGLSGIRMVRTYRLEKRMLGNANSVFENLFKLKVSMIKWQFAVSPMMEIVAGLAVAVLLYLVTWRMSTGAIDLAGFIGLLTALGVATNPAQKIGNAYARALQGVAALDRIYSLYDAKNTIKDGDFAYAEGDRANGLIEFDNVGFVYPDGYEALRNISLKIEPGTTFAFVGRSGAGKSTIFNLLPRLFDATSGAVRLDGRNINSLSLASLRDQISVVSQDSVLLKGTVLENIAFGRPDATRDACIAAAKAAAADGFIQELRGGYDTMVDPSKSAFSGGERQRISIARAILRDAPILLLDEPTSALDAESETSIREALSELSEGRTTLVIAHRLSTIKDADKIVVMDQGAIAEFGTHQELLAQDGIYADLYNLQFSQHPPRPQSQKPRSFANGGKWTSPLTNLFRHFGL
jgi:subfamily B ATP-binding cassette protein MsbA